MDNTTEDDNKPLVEKKSLVTHAENFLRRFRNEDNSYKTIGNDVIAKQLSDMVDGQLLPQFFLQAMERFGAPTVDSVVHKICQQMKTSKISNLASYFNKAISQEDFDNKMSKIEQKEPSWSSSATDRRQSFQDRQNTGSSPGIGNSNSIDSLKKENYWPLTWNKNFYRRLSRDNRQPIVNDVAHKWPYLLEHAKQMKIDLLSDEFIDDALFKTASEIINAIRFEIAAHPLRSTLWNDS
jgi:hypothetical protein